VLPSAFRRALPAYSNEVIFMLHGSVVASTITIQDLLGVGRWLNGRYYLAYEGFITAAVLYFIIVLLVSRGFRLWEKHWLKHLYPLDAVETKPKKGVASFRV
jgi:arginine/ornithine transport system permease protein